MAGRPPKPTALKILTGNPGKRKLPEGEPVPPPGEAQPPAWLSIGARRMWDLYAPRFKALKTLTVVDEPAFASWMMLLAKIAACERNGLDVSNDALAKSLAYATAFGGTGSGRARIPMPKQDAPKSKLGAFRG